MKKQKMIQKIPRPKHTPTKLKKAIFCCSWFDDTWCDKNTPLSIITFDNEYYLTLGQHLDIGWLLKVNFCPNCGKKPRKLER